MPPPLAGKVMRVEVTGGLMADLLIRDGIVITMDPQRRVLENTSVAITDGRIIDIGPTSEVTSRHKAAKVVDARRRAVLPGRGALHAHMGGGLLVTTIEGLDSARCGARASRWLQEVVALDWWR